MWSFGSTVTFTYVVTNAGNDPLANVALTDDKLGADHQLHRRHQRQRPARPERNLDLHRDGHRPAWTADKRRHRHRPGQKQHQHYCHRPQPGQLLRRDNSDVEPIPRFGDKLTLVSPHGTHFEAASDHHGSTDVFLFFA